MKYRIMGKSPQGRTEKIDEVEFLSVALYYLHLAIDFTKKHKINPGYDFWIEDDLGKRIV